MSVAQRWGRWNPHGNVSIRIPDVGEDSPCVVGNEDCYTWETHSSARCGEMEECGSTVADCEAQRQCHDSDEGAEAVPWLPRYFQGLDGMWGILRRRDVADDVARVLADGTTREVTHQITSRSRG